MRTIRYVKRHFSPVVEMCADMGINVVDVKLAVAGSVECPGAVVAHHPAGPLGGGGGGLGGLSGLVSRGVGGVITRVIQPVT